MIFKMEYRLVQVKSIAKCSIKTFVFFVFVFLFLCLFVALRPKSTAKDMTGQSVHLTTLFPGQA